MHDSVIEVHRFRKEVPRFMGSKVEKFIGSGVKVFSRRVDNLIDRTRLQGGENL